jgi:hypothetical protein
MNVGQFLAQHHLIVIVILAEWILLLMAGLCVLVLRLQAQRSELRQARSAQEQGDDEREGLTQFLQNAVQGLIRNYRARWGNNLTALHRGDHLREPAAAAQVAVQLRHDLLRAELADLQRWGEPGSAWGRRRDTWDELLKRFSQAERTLERLEETLRNQHSEDVSQERRRHAQEIDALQNKVRRRDIRIDALESRLPALEGYRERFEALHQEVLQERAASDRLRKELRDRLGDGEDRGTVEASIASYEAGTAGLDSLLQRADLQVLGAPTAKPDSRREEQQRLRTDRLAEAGAERLAATLVAMRRSLAEQQRIADDLRCRLEQAGLREGRLKTYYQTQMRQLQASIGQLQEAIERMDKEHARNRRTIRRLNAQLQAQQADAHDQAALEGIVERFATQAIEMQEKIRELERELADATAVALGAEAPAPAGAPLVPDGR